MLRTIIAVVGGFCGVAAPAYYGGHHDRDAGRGYEDRSVYVDRYAGRSYSDRSYVDRSCVERRDDRWAAPCRVEFRQQRPETFCRVESYGRRDGRRDRFDSCRR